MFNHIVFSLIRVRLRPNPLRLQVSRLDGRMSPPTPQQRKFHPLPSSTSPGNHILVLPQKCNCSDPVLHWPSTGCHVMWLQRNTPTMLRGKCSAVWCVYQFSLFKWVDASLGTTPGACVPEWQDIVASPSVVGRSVLSSENLFIELLHCHALVSYPHVYRMTWIVGTGGKLPRRRIVAPEQGSPVSVDAEWYRAMLRRDTLPNGWWTHTGMR